MVPIVQNQGPKGQELVIGALTALIGGYPITNFQQDAQPGFLSLALSGWLYRFAILLAW